MNGNEMTMGVRLEDIAHIIQVALTPVFLLTGIGSLLNVINIRLGRVADRADMLNDAMSRTAGAEAIDLYTRLVRLRRRVRALDLARGCGALAGMCVCAATFSLFMGAMHSDAVGVAFVLFGAAVLGTMACLAGFFAEVLLSWNTEFTRPEQDE
jgi:drug/metabolite transporter (DMT)-like permease